MSDHSPVFISGSSQIVLGTGKPAPPYAKLLTDVAHRAMLDSGLGADDIDGLILSTSIPQPFERKAAEVVEMLGLAPAYATTAPYGGRPATDVIHLARSAIHAGLACNVLVVSADTFGTTLGIEGTINLYMTSFDPRYERPFGPLSPTAFALMATRYLHEYGGGLDQLAQVVMTIRDHARLNPDAERPGPVTVDEVLAAPVVSSPLTRPMLPLISTGGAQGFVVTQRAQGSRPPVAVRGYGECAGFMNLPQSKTLTGFEALSAAATQALRQADIGVADLDFLEIYDAAAIVPLIVLEDLGIVGRGEAGAYITEGHGKIGGTLPIVTHGGTMGFRHPGMGAGLDSVHEAVLQLRHEAGERQVADAELGLVHGQGSWTANNGILILGRA